MNNETAEERRTHRPEKTKSDLVIRFNRIEGQIRGIRQMVEQDVYCDDILHQISSVQAALNSVSKMVLEHHLRSCVVDRIQAGETEVVDEFLKTVKTILK